MNNNNLKQYEEICNKLMFSGSQEEKKIIHDQVFQYIQNYANFPQIKEYLVNTTD